MGRRRRRRRTAMRRRKMMDPMRKMEMEIERAAVCFYFSSPAPSLPFTTRTA